MATALLLFSPDVDSRFWSAKYSRIAKLLELDPELDRKATTVLDQLMEPRKNQLGPLLERLRTLLEERTVLIFGCGPSLDRQLRCLGTVLRASRCPAIAADGATSALLENGMTPDVIVTDLDGRVADIVTASKAGAIVILHAHADNMETISRWLPDLQNVVPVTQMEPTDLVRNFGGFTDGDKCLFLAAAFGARALVLIGMDFGTRVGWRSDPNASKRRLRKRKLAKLAIGKELAEELLRHTNIRAYSVAPVPIPQALRIDPKELEKLIGATCNEKRYREDGRTHPGGRHLRDDPHDRRRRR